MQGTSQRRFVFRRGARTPENLSTRAAEKATLGLPSLGNRLSAGQAAVPRLGVDSRGTPPHHGAGPICFRIYVDCCRVIRSIIRSGTLMGPRAPSFPRPTLIARAPSNPPQSIRCPHHIT
jgi:hypothetical protein